MAEFLLNKQVNVWRGPTEPPTKYHLWIVNDRLLRLYDGTEWITFLDNPGLTVTENADGSVTIANGDTYFKLAASGSAIQLLKNDNTITIYSDAINTISTDEWLTWTNELVHNDAMPELAIATYGPLTDSTDTSSFSVPFIKVDKKGHIVEGGTKTVTVPSQVTQNPLSQTDDAEYELILAGSTDKTRQVGEVNKDESLSLIIDHTGGITKKILKTPGIEAKGDVTIQGNLEIPDDYVIKGTIVGKVEGTATPTDHADPTTKYGAGTSAGEIGEAAYGHVKLRDDLPTEAPPSGATEAGKGIAATPLMVYRAVTASKEYANGLFGDDFVKKENGKYSIAWID